MTIPQKLTDIEFQRPTLQKKRATHQQHTQNAPVKSGISLKLFFRTWTLLRFCPPVIALQETGLQIHTRWYIIQLLLLLIFGSEPARYLTLSESDVETIKFAYGFVFVGRKTQRYSISIPRPTRQATITNHSQ